MKKQTEKPKEKKEVSPLDALRVLAETGLAMDAAREIMRRAMAMQDDTAGFPDGLRNATMIGVAAGCRMLFDLLVQGCGDPDCLHLNTKEGAQVDIIYRALRREMEAVKNGVTTEPAKN